MITKPIRVLVIDDSAFARKVIREVLQRDHSIEVVGIARDGLEGLEKIEELKPDVITLDLLMPDLDGLGVLRAMPAEGAPKVIVVSVSGSDGDLAVQALQYGAVDLVTKPTALATDRLYELASSLIAKIKAAAIASPRRLAAPIEPKTPPVPTDYASTASPTRLVVIGTSTGGPQALTALFAALPADLSVPIAVALHIPAGYTAPLAARVSAASRIRLEEARDGMELIAGNAVIAPGGMHLAVRAEGTRLYAVVSAEPHDTAHHPSVDILFKSAAAAVGSGALGVILTGMGDDGLRGARAIRAQGGRILAESAISCVVYGMPRSVVEAGLANLEIPLDRIPAALVGSLLTGLA